MTARLCLVMLLASGVLAGCVAPMGLGAGPRLLPSGRGEASVSSGFGVAPSREQVQLEGSMRLQPRRWFSIETGAVYSRLHDREAGRALVVHSAMPYARPTVYVGGASLGVALTGLGMGGGGGGFGWGLIEPRVGYGTRRFALYASWQRHGALAVGGDSTTEASSQHWRVGGEHLFEHSGRFILAVELTRGDDSISVDGRDFADEYTMLSVKLRLSTGPFR